MTRTVLISIAILILVAVAVSLITRTWDTGGSTVAPANPDPGVSDNPTPNE